MSVREAMWPDLEPRSVVLEDDSLIVIDKPAGVPTQQATPEAVADDLPTRVRRFLAARDGRAFDATYLGSHQRLDRATSGVIAYAKRREANRGLAEQFEGRTVEKRYLAAVGRWPRSERKATLRHALLETDDGTMRAVAATTRGAQKAVTHVEVLERHGERALLALILETGRTHQARAQLATVGAPIAGDRWYGDALAAAPRLMLHASSLTLRHPLDSTRKLIARAPTPASFARWLERGDVAPLAGGGVDGAALDDALAVAREERFGLARAGLLTPEDPRCITAFRWVNEGGDGVPGVAIDVYGEHLVVHLYDDDAIAAREPLLDRLDALGFAGIYLKIRPKQANVIVDGRAEPFAPRAPVRGRAADDEIVVVEHGVPYLVRLGDGLSTGIFLDQRENRRRLRAMCAGKRVLNLFAYTCPFTLAAAAGGASRTVSVDASKPAIERARRGLVHAELDGDQHELLAEDVFAYLERATKRGERFDLVILDPPSYSSVGASRFTATQYAPLASKAMAVVAEGGTLLACTNHRQTVRAKLRRLLHEAARAAGRAVVQMKDLPAPVDFPPPWAREAHLKSVLVRLG